MTESEHAKILDHMWTITRRFCVMFSDDTYRVTPPMIWAGGKFKKRAVANARAAVGFTLRCTIGRRKLSPEFPGKGPWEIHAAGIPADGTYQQFSYPLIAQYCGADHTTFVLRIQDLKLDNQFLVDKISDAHATQLARDIALFIALEKQWKQEEAETEAVEAQSKPVLNSQVNSRGGRGGGHVL